MAIKLLNIKSNHRKYDSSSCIIDGIEETSKGKARPLKLWKLWKFHAPGNTDTIVIQISEDTPTSTAIINGSTTYCLSLRFVVLYSDSCKCLPMSTLPSKTCNNYPRNVVKISYAHDHQIVFCRSTWLYYGNDEFNYLKKFHVQLTNGFWFP